jgi:tetratricopeptide (TPR) repeat protein
MAEFSEGKKLISGSGDENEDYNKRLSSCKIEKHNRTLKECDKAIKIDPKDTFAWYHKGTTFDELGRCEEAIEAYKKVLEIDPKNNSASERIKEIEKRLKEKSKIKKGENESTK